MIIHDPYLAALAARVQMLKALAETLLMEIQEMDQRQRERKS